MRRIRRAAAIVFMCVPLVVAPGAPCHTPLVAQEQAKEGLAVVDFEVRSELSVKDARAIVAELFIGGIDEQQYQLCERPQTPARRSGFPADYRQLM